jgi:glycine oxidase
VKAIRRDGTVISSDRVIIAAGAWTQRFLSIDATTNAPNIRPIRGQIALLREESPTLTSIIERGKKYVVPRGDGHVLIGSTEDDIGFDRSTAQEAIEDLVEFAKSLVPSLRAAVLEKAWAGLRPWNGSSVPWMGWLKSHGEVQGTEPRVLLMAGHFRHGLQMSPATAQVAKQLILGESPDITLPLLPDGLALKPAHPN